jgi:hypothetical protein
MENKNLEKGKFTPRVLLDAENGLIEIEGDSLPENTYEFYQPILDWVEEYFKNPKLSTTINFELSYFNSGSSKALFDMMDILAAIKENDDKGLQIEINWIYDEENESMEEEGEEFIEEFEDLNINLVTK